MSVKFFALDTETMGLEAALNPDIPLWMIVTADDEGAREETLEQVQERLDGGEIMIAHNASFDVAVLRLRGLRIRPGQYHDTMIMSHTLDTRRAHGLGAWGEELGYAKLDYHDFSKRTDEMLTYALRDVELTWKVYQHIKSKLTKAQRDYYKRIALPYVESIIEMQSAGIQLDLNKLTELDAQLKSEAERLHSSLILLHPYVEGDEVIYARGYRKYKGEVTYNHCKLESFNPGSGDQVSHLLQEFYGWVPAVFSDKSGKPKTSADILEEIDIPEAHEFLQLLSKYNNAVKMRSTFIGKWAEVNDNGIIYPGLNQTGTITGRLSSSGKSGNFQNIPARGDYGAIIRSIITHPDGYHLFGGDMSNLEGRVLASVLYQYTGDDTLVRVFQQGLDFHSSNAEAWGLNELVQSFLPDSSIESIRKHARTLAKTALYAVLYGAGAAKIAAGASRGMPVRMTKADGELVMQTMKDSMPSIFETKELFWNEVRRNKGWMYTELGRPIYYPDMLSRDRSLRARAERQTFNARLQGSAADIMLDLQIKTTRRIHELGAWWILHVHDEDLGYAPPETSAEVVEYLTHEFSTAQYLAPVPLKAVFTVGETWDDIH